MHAHKIYRRFQQTATLRLRVPPLKLLKHLHSLFIAFSDVACNASKTLSNPRVGEVSLQGAKDL
ncbi:hypothetical protein J7L06_09550 [Candidatus Bathyarchaeota archaeon]|nr:hypothetical protein [Candidatus Bathyarchaeota archaeon]